MMGGRAYDDGYEAAPGRALQNAGQPGGHSPWAFGGAQPALEPGLCPLPCKGEAAPGAPFGTEVRRMLDTAMADIRALGFPGKDYDGYACDAEMGQGGTDHRRAGLCWATWTWCPPGTAGRRRQLTPVREGDRIMAGAPATTRAR